MNAVRDRSPPTVPMDSGLRRHDEMRRPISMPTFSLSCAPALAAFALLAACDVGAQAAAQPAASNPGAWTVGPIIRGRNHSVGAALHPTPRRGGGWQIEL